jgi:hypothetical protein
VAEGTNKQVRPAPRSWKVVVAWSVQEGREVAVEHGLDPTSRQIAYVAPGRMAGVRGIRSSWDDVIWGLHWAHLSVRDWEQLTPAMHGGIPPQAE